MTTYTPHVEEQPDEWHLHTADEGEPQEAHAAKANPLILLIAFSAITGSVLIVSVVVAIFFNYSSPVIRQQRVETTVLSSEHRAYRDQSQANLDQVGWADSAAGTVRIPLGDAMSQVVDRYRGP